MPFVAFMPIIPFPRSTTPGSTSSELPQPASLSRRTSTSSDAELNGLLPESTASSSLKDKLLHRFKRFRLTTQELTTARQEIQTANERITAAEIATAEANLRATTAKETTAVARTKADAADVRALAAEETCAAAIQKALEESERAETAAATTAATILELQQANDRATEVEATSAAAIQKVKLRYERATTAAAIAKLKVDAANARTDAAKAALASQETLAPCQAIINRLYALDPNLFKNQELGLFENDAQTLQIYCDEIEKQYQSNLALNQIGIAGTITFGAIGTVSLGGAGISFIFIPGLNIFAIIGLSIAAGATALAGVNGVISTVGHLRNKDLISGCAQVEVDDIPRPKSTF